MATKMVMPLLGQTMEEGTIIQWFKKEGDQIKAGEPLLEVLTDKVNMEVEAPQDGVLRKILANPDDIIPVKEPIAIIGTADEPIDDLLAAGGETQPAEVAEAGAPTVEQPAPTVAEPSAPASAAVSSARAFEPSTIPVAQGRVFASPAARRVASEHGIDVSVLAGRGTGPNGRIVEKDVLDYLASTKATPLAEKIAADTGVQVGAVAGTGIGGKVTAEDVRKAAAAAPAPALAIGQTIPFAGIRKAVAQNVTASYQQAPHVTLNAEVDMTECVAFRNSIVKSIEERYGVRVSYTDIIVKAAARAIEDKPLANATLQGDQIVIHDQINIGVATAIEGGLVVPVVKNVTSKSIPQISKEIKELVARARAGQAGGDDFRGGTFTVTNLGAYGIDSFSPIITPGQSMILGVCRIAEKPAVVNGEIKIRSMMNLSLSFDHRIVDGAPAAEYLARLREILESPYLIFM
jgi:pyruvate dehydrogenase E2 component (dihydrolipoamide acetyltransferase)